MEEIDYMTNEELIRELQARVNFKFILLEIHEDKLATTHNSEGLTDTDIFREFLQLQFAYTQYLDEVRED